MRPHTQTAPLRFHSVALIKDLGASSSTDRVRAFCRARPYGVFFFFFFFQACQTTSGCPTVGPGSSLHIHLARASPRGARRLANSQLSSPPLGDSIPRQPLWASPQGPLVYAMPATRMLQAAETGSCHMLLTCSF